MKVEQILIQPIGQRFNAGTLTVKTCKKTWQVKETWYHQVVFMDDTGEIPADVKIGKYLPLKRGQQVSIIIGIVRDAEYLGKPRKVLYVEQYSLPTMMVDEYENRQDDILEDYTQIVRSKIKCLLTAGYASREASTPDNIELYANSDQLDRTVDGIMGEKNG